MDDYWSHATWSTLREYDEQIEDRARRLDRLLALRAMLESGRVLCSARCLNGELCRNGVFLEFGPYCGVHGGGPPKTKQVKKPPRTDPELPKPIPVPPLALPVPVIEVDEEGETSRVPLLGPELAYRAAALLKHEGWMLDRSKRSRRYEGYSR